MDFPQYRIDMTRNSKKEKRTSNNTHSSSSKWEVHLADSVITAKNTPLFRPLVWHETDIFRPLDFQDIPVHRWIAEPTGPICPNFLERFLEGLLEYEEKRYIGFREQTDRQELIERTVLQGGGGRLDSRPCCQIRSVFNFVGRSGIR